MKNKKEVRVNAALQNMLAPGNIEYGINHIISGENYEKGLLVTRFPSKARYEWLTDICNTRSNITAITYEPELQTEDIIKSIGNVIKANEAIVSSDVAEIARAEKTIQDGTQIINDIAINNDSVGYMYMASLVLADDEADLKNKAVTVKNNYAGQGFGTRIMPFFQKDIYNAVCPVGEISENIKKAGQQIMPIETFFGGFPFAFSGYNDGTGIYIGRDNTGAPIIVDLWRRGNDRTNSNLVLMGITGVGKSTILKHLMQAEWELGTKIIVIDPHGEYKELCNALGGEWINLASGAGQLINPLQIYLKSSPADDEAAEENNKNALALHINNLEVFFKIYFNNITDLHIAALKYDLELTYAKKNISWETDIRKLTPEDFPILDDLYQVVGEQADLADKSIRQNETNYHRELFLLLRNIVKGSDSHIWNGISTVNPKSSFVVFDTSTVNSNAANIKSAMYHTVLNYCEDYLNRRRDEQVILVCDEAHNVIDERLPDTVKRLANMEKSVRKWTSAMWICSQQLMDFLADSIKKEGEALLDQPNIKILMPVGKGKNLKSLKDLYDLTDSEEDRLMQQERGTGLLFIGKRRLSVSFAIPPHHLKNMGTGGGK